MRIQGESIVVERDVVEHIATRVESGPLHEHAKALLLLSDEGEGHFPKDLVPEFAAYCLMRIEDENRAADKVLGQMKNLAEKWGEILDTDEYYIRGMYQLIDQQTYARPREVHIDGPIDFNREAFRIREITFFEIVRRAFEWEFFAEKLEEIRQQNNVPPEA